MTNGLAPRQPEYISMYVESLQLSLRASQGYQFTGRVIIIHPRYLVSPVM